jgi:hypothetical protein
MLTSLTWRNNSLWRRADEDPSVSLAKESQMLSPSTIANAMYKRMKIPLGSL